MRSTRLALLITAPFALVAGCATVPASTVAEDSLANLYGTWNWTQPGAPANAPQAQLILNRDATYQMFEYGPGRAPSAGRFGAYRAVGEDSLDPWIELERGETVEQWVFQFVGRDTLLLREGDSGYPVTDSEVNLLVRARADQPPSMVRSFNQDQPYDQAPVPLKRVSPKYPEFARVAQIEGTVVMHVLVGVDGLVQDVKVARGVKGLDEAAVIAVKQWTFQPAMKDGRRVEGWVEVPIDFQL